MRDQYKRRLEYDSREVADMFQDLRAQPTYPVIQGDPLLLLYDWRILRGAYRSSQWTSANR